MEDPSKSKAVEDEDPHPCRTKACDFPCAAVPALYHLRPARPLAPPAFTTCVTFAVGGSPENPPCARLVLSGAVVKVTDASEEASAKAALFARHPVCRSAARTPDREAPDLLLTR